MSALLDQIQERMEGHFQTLNAARAGTGFPLFLLEHDLDEQELQQLRMLLLERLRTHSNLAKHWLLWAIYATEQGYAYTGHEYWHSFEESTPHWDDRDRGRLTGWFGRFKKEYEAVVPTGPWAQHFNRIAWPITHAILPKYLQNQFARALWELSYRIANLTVFDAQSVGRLFSLHAHGSSRFHEFLEQEELTGRIVLALLGQHAQSSTSPISPKTLDRLVGDLEQLRHRREWLREARRIVRDRFTGIGQGSGAMPPRDWTPASQQQLLPEPSVSPSILLRSKGAGIWTALLDIPDFRPIATNTEVREFLNSNRARLAGIESTRPAGWVMGARRQAVLENWPSPGSPLVRFERPNGVIDNVLAHHCAMSKGPTWLFRIGADGLAREIIGRIVRPGASYLLLGQASLPEPGGWVSEARIECADVFARRLTIPVSIAPEDEAALRALDLQVAKTIRVWPAGLPGRAWNGEGSSDWLTTEAPCLGLVHDHPIEGFSIRLNGGAETIIEGGRVGFPTFVRLPHLSPGVHHVSVRAHHGLSAFKVANAPEAEGYLTLNVRDPNPWLPGRSFHSGLIVATDPIDPDLDAILENRVDLSVLGPDDHQIRCILSLKRGDGEEILSEAVGESLKLPLNAVTWNRHFARFLEKHGERFLEAANGQLTIQADELGEFHVPFERNVLPIRWILKHSDGNVFTKLVDDTGEEYRIPTVTFREFGQPLRSSTLPVEGLRSGMNIPAPGGLLSASLDRFTDTVVISAAGLNLGLQELGAQASFPELDLPVVDWEHAFRAISFWQTARLAGVLLPLRRDQVVEDFQSAVFRRICGPNWSRAEQQFLTRLNEEKALEGLKRNVDRIQSFAGLLIRERHRLDGDFDEAATWFAGRASQYFAVAPSLGGDALRFAADPCRIAEQKGNSLNAMIREMMAAPEVLRAARLSALLSANPPGATIARAYPRWLW